MASNLYKLSVRRGPEEGQSFPLSKDSVTIGRDPMVDIVLSDPEVSRQHARLTHEEEGFLIQDLGSTNGTFVDGRRLGGEPVRISTGTVITMGSNVTLVLEAPPEPTATVISAEGVDFPEAEEEAESEGEIVPAAEPLPPAPEEAEVEEAQGWPEDFGETGDEATSVEVAAAEAPESVSGLEEVADELPSFEEPALDSEVSPEARTVLDMEVEETPFSFEAETEEEARGWEAQEEGPGEEPPAIEKAPEAELPSFGEEEAVYTPSGSEGGAPPPPPTSPPEGNRNRSLLIAAVVILLLCCCCLLLVSYLWLGDIVLEFMGQF